MSLKTNIRKISTLVGSIVLLAAFGFWSFKMNASVSRAPASATPLQSHGFIPLKHTRKMESLIQTQIEKVSIAEVAPGTPFRLKATVGSRRPLSGAEVRWILPSGVRIVSGSPGQGSLDLQPGISREFEIELVSDRADNDRVLFETRVYDGTKSMSKTGVYNIYLQEELNETKRAAAAEMLAQ